MTALNTDTAVFERRRERLRPLMRKAGINALLVTDAASRFYLSGFELHDPQPNESAGRLIITLDDAWLCTDSRYLDAAKRLWQEDRIFIYSGGSAENIGEFFKNRLYGAFGFEASSVSVEWWDMFSEHLNAASYVSVPPLVSRLRVIKDSDEITRIRTSCALNEKMMQWLPGHLSAIMAPDAPGMTKTPTEASLAWDIERFFRENGAEESAFATIAALNQNAALPHAIPSTAVSLNGGGIVLVDAGCRVNGYCSDQTRVFPVGDNVHNDFKRTLDRVCEAQRRAIAAIRPGVSGKDVFMEAWNYFADRHCEKNFTHGLGHGVGLETHEAPSLSSRSDTILQAGMVVTVEPGLYYPEWGGVRWEYTVLVTEDGCEILR